MNKEQHVYSFTGAMDACYSFPICKDPSSYLIGGKPEYMVGDSVALQKYLASPSGKNCKEMVETMTGSNFCGPNEVFCKEAIRNCNKETGYTSQQLHTVPNTSIPLEWQACLQTQWDAVGPTSSHACEIEFEPQARCLAAIPFFENAVAKAGLDQNSDPAELLRIAQETICATPPSASSKLPTHDIVWIMVAVCVTIGLSAFGLYWYFRNNKVT